MNSNRVKIFCLYVCMLVMPIAQAQLQDESAVQEFIGQMVAKHGFDRTQLISMFSQAKVSNTILEAISRPAEAMPWYKYRTIFIQDERIRLGVEFMKQNRDTLLAAEQQYGVPSEIITAIIGVETRYGKNAGNYKVIDSLATLGFKYPKRGEFFRSELEQFLLMTREQKLDPQSVKGSYAGAMGIPQFISSSFRNFAIDFDRDGHIDIWENPADAIGSVANYFSKHGWVSGENIATQATARGDRYKELIDTALEPNLTLKQISGYGVSIKTKHHPDKKAKLLRYEMEKGEQLWLGFTNFYVITRYNHSALYAMAVYQLADAISHEQGNKDLYRND